MPIFDSMKRTKNISEIVKKVANKHAPLTMDVVIARLAGRDLFPKKTERAQHVLRALNKGNLRSLVNG
jgi:hypothetical protein